MGIRGAITLIAGASSRSLVFHTRSGRGPVTHLFGSEGSFGCTPGQAVRADRTVTDVAWDRRCNRRIRCPGRYRGRMATVSENITRSQAVARAELIRVHSYVIALDLREVESSATFVSTSTVRFAARRAGGVHVDRPAGRGGAVRRAQRPPAGHQRLRRGPAGTGGPRGRQRARGERPLPVHEHRRGPAPLGGPRATGRSTCTRSAPPPTPAGCSPASSSPTSRPRSPGTSSPRQAGRWSPTARRPSPWPVGPGLARWVFPPTPPLPTYLAAAVRRTVPRRALGVHGPARHLSARGLRPGVDGRAPGRRGDPRDHPRRAGPLRA